MELHESAHQGNQAGQQPVGIIQGENDEWLDTWDLQLLDLGGGEEEGEGEEGEEE